MNNLQENPSDATAGTVHPDWNSKHGQGVEPSGDDAMDFDEIFATQRETAKQRVEDNPPKPLAGSDT